MLAGLIQIEPYDGASPRSTRSRARRCCSPCAEPGGAIPSPPEVGRALATLWTERGLFDQLSASFRLEVAALAGSFRLPRSRLLT